MFAVELIEGERREIDELADAVVADAVVGFIFAFELVAHGEGVAGADLIVDSWTEVRAGARIVDRVTKWNDREGRWINDLGADNGQLIDIATLEIEEE